MNAKIAKWCEGERVLLSDVVPLDTPISLMIEPANACNFRCNYCQISYKEKKLNNMNMFNEIMDYSIFEKVVEDAKKFPNKIKTINFSRFGEPLLNKRLPEMINLAKKNNICDLTKIITNGSMLSPNLNYKLLDAGLDVLRISVQGISEKQILETCGYKVDFSKFIDNISHFYKNRGKCKVFIKILDSIIEGEEDKFFNIFGDICDEIAIEHLINVNEYAPDTDENNKEKLTNMVGEKCDCVDACSSPFYSINICADGNISPCCSDVDERIVFGNVREQSIGDIWNSKKMNQFRIMHLQNKRYNHPVCGMCSTPTYAKQTNDNIDVCKDKLLKYYKQFV